MLSRVSLRMLGGVMAVLALPALVCGARLPQQAGGQNPAAAAQDVPETQEQKKTPEPKKTKISEARSDDSQGRGPSATRGLLGLGKDFAEDQKQIWTSPARLRFSDTEWLVPLSGISAGLFVTDRDFSKHLSHNPSTISHYKTLSDAGIAALVGGAGGMWLLGHASHNEHWSETGFLAGEAAVNSFVVVEGLKYSLRRQRPYQGDGSGPFFQSGGTSFPSEHAAAAWSVAGVIAHEYPGPLTKILAYGLASLVSVSRVKAHQHFNSDVLIGSVIGNLIAQDIYSRHHDPELGGEAWRSISHVFRDSSGSPGNQGSPYVPLDSWIYPALDRLVALGLSDSGFAGMRPWTRRECARLLTEAEEELANSQAGNDEASSIMEMLQREFRPETESADGTSTPLARLESVYSRTEHISGTPLRDGYHFAQTQINDFGRPYGEGWNTASGFSFYSTAGRWSGYIRGELQTAPSVPALSLAARQSIANSDALPSVPPAMVTPPVEQFRLMDAYVGLTFSNWDTTFGRQSLSWGPGAGGSLGLSDNAPPIDMIRVNRVTPLWIPLISRIFGPMRTEFFLGQLTGHELLLSSSGSGLLIGQFGEPLDPQPFIHGEKVSFKPTRNFEFGFYRTTIYGGPGYPLTWSTFLHSVFSTTNAGTVGTREKAGNRTSELDFSYRLPRLRDWVTFYGEGYTDDQYSPIAYADRSAWHAGLYFSHFPRIAKLDLRMEGVYTDVPGGGGAIAPGQFYYNNTWRSGYTNGGDLLGSWVGRGGQGAQAWANYWFTARDRIQFSFRHQKVSQRFVPGGGTLTDAGVRTDYWVRSNLGLSASVQYEKWLFPVIQPGAERNVSASLQILFQPQKVLNLGKLLGNGSGTGDEQ